MRHLDEFMTWVPFERRKLASPVFSCVTWRQRLSDMQIWHCCGWVGWGWGGGGSPREEATLPPRALSHICRWCCHSRAHTPGTFAPPVSTLTAFLYKNVHYYLWISWKVNQKTPPSSPHKPLKASSAEVSLFLNICHRFHHLLFPCSFCGMRVA